MCGIAGFISYKGSNYSQENALVSMLSTIDHRGPDAHGEFIHQNIALGHTRLSIIDLTHSANQPFFSSNNQHAIIYNGEIYNYKELKNELKEEGFSFNTNSDTEVVLNAYLHWGVKFLDKLNGMFALVIYDKKSNNVFMARDRYGIKPLYYYLQDNTFIFASEVKAIEAHPAYKFEVDKEGLREYFSFQNFISNKTLNKNVYMFPAGHFTNFNSEFESELNLIQYWDFEFQEIESSRSSESYAEELDTLFQNAVSRQLVSDVPVGSYLSGGMDSGSITAIAAKQIPNMHTFTCGFDMSSSSAYEKTFDERIKAQEFSKYFDTTHHEKIITREAMESSIPTIAWHLDEPRVGQSYPNYYAAELASSQVTVVMSGTGGDELFAGYPWRYYRALNNNSKKDYLDTYYAYWQRLVPESQQKNFFKPIWNEVKDYSPKESFESVYKSDSLNEAKSDEDFINQSLYFESKTFLHGLLQVEDKLSMAHSLESRVPMLDNDLVDFAQKIPSRFKLGNIDIIKELYSQNKPEKVEQYFHRSQDGKIILRQAMKHHLPEETSEREKQGFSGPDASWFAKDSMAFIKEELIQNFLPIYNFIDKTAITIILEKHFSGEANYRLLIWSLLSFSNWTKKRF